jgi:hypothetical protein
MVGTNDLYRPIARIEAFLHERIEAFLHERNENFVLVLAAMKKSADMTAAVQARPRGTNCLAAIRHRFVPCGEHDYAAEQIFFLLFTVNY